MLNVKRNLKAGQKEGSQNSFPDLPRLELFFIPSASLLLTCPPAAQASDIEIKTRITVIKNSDCGPNSIGIIWGLLEIQNFYSRSDLNQNPYFNKTLHEICVHIKMSGAVISPTHWSILPLSQRVSPSEAHQSRALGDGGASSRQWPLTRVLTEEWELPGEGGVWANKGREGLSQEKTPMHKDSDGKIIWPAFTFPIYHFLNSFSIFTGHELGSYEIISEQCRSTLLPKTLIYEIWTHKQMKSYYHFAINGFNFQMDSLGIRRQDYGWLLNSSIWVWTYTLPFVGGNGPVRSLWLLICWHVALEIALPCWENLVCNESHEMHLPELYVAP